LLGNKFEKNVVVGRNLGMVASTDDFIKMTATEAVARLRSKEVSPLDLVEASIRRIETIDTEVNALPIHCFDQARDQAKIP
jgi:amidase